MTIADVMAAGGEVGHRVGAMMPRRSFPDNENELTRRRILEEGLPGCGIAHPSPPPHHHHRHHHVDAVYRGLLTVSPADSNGTKCRIRGVGSHSMQTITITPSG